MSVSIVDCEVNGIVQDDTTVRVFIHIVVNGREAAKWPTELPRGVELRPVVGVHGRASAVELTIVAL